MVRVQKKQKTTKILLASGSPRRRELLKPYFRLRVWIPRIDESPSSKELPRHYVKRIASEKWMACVNHFKKDSEDIILAADTIVVLNNKIFGKPKNKNHALKILSELSGKTHEVITSVAIGRAKTKRPKILMVISRVKFRKLTKDELSFYLKKNEWKDKAGAYGIQGAASVFVESIYGSLSNIVGLPVAEVLDTIQKLA